MLRRVRPAPRGAPIACELAVLDDGATGHLAVQPAGEAPGDVGRAPPQRWARRSLRSQRTLRTATCAAVALSGGLAGQHGVVQRMHFGGLPLGWLEAAR